MGHRRKTKQNEWLQALPFLLVLWIIWKSLSQPGSSRSAFDLVLLIVAILILAPVLLWGYRRHQRTKLRALLLSAGTTNPMQLTPDQYEKFCAALLENSGWKVQLTGKTGDYGADIIASKNGRKLVVQCKQWSKSVGIKAVQEAHAALSHYGATQAIVVTTTGYTPSARELSGSTGVLLLSHEDLARM